MEAAPPPTISSKNFCLFAGTLIFSKLHTDREQTIKGKLSSYSQPVGLLSVVNKDYQWTAQQVQSETTAKVLSLSELPKIETLFKQ